MERRSFVQAAGLSGLTGVLAAGAAPAVHARGLIRWRMAPGSSRGIGSAAGAAESLSRLVAEMTDGRFQIALLADAPGSTPAGSIVDAAQSGSVDIVHTTITDLIARDEAFAFAAGTPFGLDARQTDAWMLAGNGQAMMRALHAEHGLVDLPGGHTGAPLGGWFHHPLNNLEDVRGLRLHATGLTARVLERLGAEVQPLSPSEIVPALQSGHLDASHFAGPHDDLQLGLHRAASHCAYPGFETGGCRLEFLVNRRAHAALPRHEQAVLEAAARQVHAEVLARYDMLNPLALRQLVAHGARLFRLQQSTLEAAFEEAQGVCAELCSRNPAMRGLWEGQRKACAEMRMWQRFAETAFDGIAAASVI